MFGIEMTMKEIQKLERNGDIVFKDSESFGKNGDDEELFIVNTIVSNDGSVMMF